MHLSMFAISLAPLAAMSAGCARKSTTVVKAPAQAAASPTPKPTAAPQLLLRHASASPMTSCARATATRGEIDARGTDETSWQVDRRVDLELLQ